MKIHPGIVAFALGILVSGCGPSEFDTLVESTQKQSKAAKVKAAALPLFGLTNIATASLPREITSLPILAGDPKSIRCWRASTHAIVLMTGGGFGHWGLVVCQAGFESEAKDSVHGVTTLWGDGVFFWQER